ncbi:MAG: hypothetical protein P8L30_04170 [Longimicrobiales bacterium]|nr:hypothetical protein [Longimicrobiales bacterium]
MRHRDNALRKALAAWLPALLVILSVAVPALERDEFAAETVVESEHAPGTCPTAHDHTVCTQVGANLSVASASTKISHDHAIVLASAPVEALEASRSVFMDGHPTRGPPLT